MNELVAAINAALDGIIASVNSALKPLPPVEQFQANAELSGPLHWLRDAGARLNEQTLLLKGKLAVVTAEALAKEPAVRAELLKSEDVITAIKAELISKGHVLDKTTHESAVTAAVNEAKTNERSAVTAEFESKATAATERAKLTSEHKILPTLAEKVLDSVLLDPAQRAAAVVTLKERSAKLAKLKMDADPEQAPFVAEIAELALDAAGTTIFASRIMPIEKALAKAGKLPKETDPNLNPLAAGGDEGGPKSHLRFI